MIIIFITFIISLAIAFIIYLFIGGLKTKDQLSAQNEPEQVQQDPLPERQKPKTRKHNFRYYYKSKETGNIYPAEYWHMNNYIDFAVKGVNFSGNLSEYVGEFVGRLVAEPENEHDPNAISVRHKDGRHIGYVPKNLTQKVRDFKELPCDCYCYIERRRDDDGDHYFFALCYVTERPFGE